jgi:hypothetical protein
MGRAEEGVERKIGEKGRADRGEGSGREVGRRGKESRAEKAAKGYSVLF